MRHSRQHHKLAIPIGKLLEEIADVIHGRDAVVLAAHQHHRSQHLLWIHQRQLRRHVEVSPSGHLIAELQLFIRQELGQGGIGGPGFIARENGADHGAVAQPAVVGAVKFQAFGTLGQGG